MNRKAGEIFLEAREMPAAKRTAFLVGACGKDLALRAKVEALLKADVEAGSFMAAPSKAGDARPADAAAANAAAASSEQAGAQIGRYKLLEKIGEGGMGTIWMAEQREPVRRRVALKIIKLGMDTKQVIARFEAERQALAMMDHPNIAKVLDAGATDAGRPYFVMEYIKGIPILEYCDREKVDTRTRLVLFIHVCHAIQHAHHKGIIHRDIKPTNVLVTLHDGVPMPKVIDFGIAKATNSELTTKTLFTEHRQMIGTPAYMSPEQAEMSGLDIDTRSDVYSLGVLLYELLTGSTPFDMQALLESGFAEMMRTIREVEPHRPSTRISTLGSAGTKTAQQRRSDVRKLSSLLRGDLDWIVMKCLEKDRTRRYDTANGLAADLARHLNHETVTAGAPSAAYRLRKFVRRNRVQVIAGGLVIGALLVGLVGTSWGLVEQGRARSAKQLQQLEDQKRSSEEDARRDRNAEAVAALLVQCEDALHAGDASKAAVALDAARRRAAEGGADRETDRLARLDGDLELLKELDAIDQYRWTWNQNSFGNESVAATRAHEALQDFGADPEFVSVEEAAERVSASAIRGRIVLVMNRLFFQAHDEKDTAEPLRDVLRRVDSDAYRDAFREAVISHDSAKVTAFARDPKLLEQPPEFVAALGRTNMIPEERQRELLQAALIRRPSDINLLMTMQGLPSLSPDDKAPERIRWLQAAIAAAPQNSAAYTNLGLALTKNGQKEKSVVCYRKAIELNPEDGVAHNNLGASLNAMGRFEEGSVWVRKSIALDPTKAWAHSNLGEALAALGRWDEAIACYRKALEVDPKDAYVHAVLGDAMRFTGKTDEAIASYRKAIELDPKEGKPYVFLGEVLLKQGKTDEALATYRKAVELDPEATWLRGKLGDALRSVGRLDEAIAVYRKAIEIDPAYNAYGCLGEAFKAQNRWAEAIPCYRKAVELDPTLAACHFALGLALYSDRQLDASIACFRKVIDLDPNNSDAHQNLGVALHESGRDTEALASYRRAGELEPKRPLLQLNIAMTLQALGQNDAALDGFRRTLELDPRNAVASYNLGVELGAKRRFDEAIAAYRRTIEIDANYAEAHCNLSTALQNTGRFAEAVPCIRRGHELGSKRADWRYPTAEWVRQAELRAALDEKLEDLVAGRVEPADDEERLESAQMCHIKGLDHAAVELYAEAFAADSRLADDLDTRHRLAAAVSAARAAAGRGEDSSQLDDRERARLRKQALTWLRAELALLAKRLETAKPADRAALQRRLREWQVDSDLACIRDPAELDALPDEDRGAFEELWLDVTEVADRSAGESR